MLGTIRLKDSDPIKGDALFLVIRRDELRSVVLNGHEVAWSSSAGDYECEFYKGDDQAPEIAALFFYTLIGDLAHGVTNNDSGDSSWESTEGSWLVDGIEVEELLDKPTPPVAA